MKEKQNLKSRIIRYMVYFLGSMLACTIISRSIHDYLLPAVTTTKVVEGAVEVKQYAIGKIGLDENALKQNQAQVISCIAGKVVKLTKSEGDYVKAGEVIGQIQKEVDLKVRQDEAIEQAQLSQEMNQSSREKEQKQEKIQNLKKKYEQKEEELKEIEQNYTIINLKEAIKEQEKVMTTNEALYEAGAISEKEQEEVRLKCEQLKRELEETRKSLIKDIQDVQAGYQEEISALEETLTQLDEKYSLSAQKREKLGTDVTQEAIISPISGYIDSLQVASGAYVEAHEKLMVIVPEGLAYTLSFELPEEAANKVNVGQEVNFNWSHNHYQAKVIKKSFQSESGKMKISCKLEQETLEQMKLDYRSYRTVNVEAASVSEDYPMLISNRALQKEYNSYSIYGIEEKQQLGRTSYVLHKIPVTVLEEGDFKSAISGSLDQSLKYVEGNLSELKDGQEVTLK